MRRDVVAYMRAHADEFSFLFESADEYERYLATMARNGTWGDELTLRAACQAFRSTVHVLTSEKEHFYVKYAPDTAAASPASSSTPPPAAVTSSLEPMDVFLCFISPVHYNSIVAA